MHNHDQNAQDPYRAYESTIQEILYRSLDKPDFPLPAKLFSLASFAHAMHPFFFSNTQSFEVEKMATVVDKLSTHQFEQVWLQDMEQQKVDLELPMSLVLSFWLRAFRHAGQDMREMLALIWDQYFDSRGEHNPFLHVDEAEETTTVKCAEAAVSYTRYRDRLWSVFGSELNRYVQNYCTHFVFAKSYIQVRSLPAYVQEMLIRVMLLKFLLSSHPRVHEVLEQAEGQEEKDLLQALDSQVMQIMRTFSNNIPNQHEAVDALLKEMQEQKLYELAHKAVMIHF